MLMACGVSNQILPQRQVQQPARGAEASDWKYQRGLAGAECDRMTCESLDGIERGVADDGRRRRLAVKEVLYVGAGEAAINNVGGDDGDKAGGLAAVAMRPDAAASVKQGLVAIEVLNLEQAAQTPHVARRSGSASLSGRQT